MVTSWTPWATSYASMFAKPLKNDTLKERVDKANNTAGLVEMLRDETNGKLFADAFARVLSEEGLALCRVLPDGKFERIAPVEAYPAKPLDGSDYNTAPRYLDSTGYKGRK